MNAAAPATLAWIRLPAAGIDPLRLLEAWPGQPAAAFLPPRGPAIVSVGHAAVLRARGEDRFERIADGARDLLASIDREAGPAGPRLVGGLAFRRGSADGAPWSEFGDATFVLPRLAWIREEGRAWLCATLPAAIPCRTRAPRRGTSRAERVEQMPLERWARGVDSIRDGIAAGRFEKVVLARRARVVLSGQADPLAIFARIRARHPESTAYLFRPGRAAFLGATPERLVARRGTAVRTEALAGTARALPGAAERLVASAKDRREHAPVVRHLLDRLGPCCRRVEPAAGPGARRLPGLVHLATPIRGELARPVHVLDLVRALHPTPAVGGSPSGAALDWIASGEEAPRGWYAGPFGWFDAEGDGDFAVALRGGVVEGRRAWAWAGAGIVAGSDAAAEYEETSLKLAPFLGAVAGEGSG